ncbi:SHOCT domain-containing protein [Promineifilum sp.]|uniref:SHOCT domain-containing protein n=1 Tax=Promineifilum sp. TaxID=2664178 RepID=UPI0031CC96A7
MDASAQAKAAQQQAQMEAAAQQALANQQAQMAQQQAMMAPQAAPAAPAGGDMMTKLTELAKMKEAGILTDEEFSAAKAKLLS